MVILPGQRGEARLDIPAGCLGEVLSPRQVQVPASFANLLLDALTQPIGCGPLRGRIRAGQKVLIVSDDNTRMTPVAEVLPILLAHLAAAGCRPDDISLAMALGTHRPMTRAEIERKLGREAAASFKVINDPAQRREAFISCGEFSNGAPVEVHRAVLEADIVVGIGSVVPHSEAGWSGGCKMILPGMCSERTVMENHRLAADFEGNALGQETTPVRRNMEEIVAAIGFDFSINLVLTPTGDVVGVFAGHFIAAQRAAVQAARQVYATPYSRRADIVVSNAYPAEIDFWQASKGIFSGELLVKHGGAVILNAPCHEGCGPHPDFLRFIQAHPEELRAGLASGAIADVTAAALALPVARMLDHMRLFVVSPGLPPNEFAGRRVRHYLTLVEALSEALAEAFAEAQDAALDAAQASHIAERGTGRHACQVSVLTHGGYTYPASVAA